MVDTIRPADSNRL